MSSKFLKMALMAVLAIGMAACDDDSDNNKGSGNNNDPAPSVVCAEGAVECDGNNLKRCVNNSWQSTPCSDGCDAAAKQCIVPAGVTPKCTENEKRCNGDNLETCISNDWHSDKCDNGCDTATNQCKAASQPEPDTGCKDGDLKCDGNDLKVCASKAWTVKESCSNGCDASKKACNAASQPEPDTSCKDGDLKCDGNDLKVCASKAWTVKESCSNGCDASKKACNAGSTPGEKCTANDKKCDGDYVTICSGGDWQKAKNACPNGCENGACKTSSDTPATGLKEGDACDEKTESVCNGETLFYCGCKDEECKAGIIKKANCADASLVCKTSKIGGASCVDPSVKDDCKKEGDMFLYSEGSCEDYGDYDGSISALYCEKIDGQFYGVDVYADSVCIEDEELGKIAVACVGSGDEDLNYVKCSKSCTMSTTPEIEENDVGAVCDGSPVTGDDVIDDAPWYCGDQTVPDKGKTLDELCAAEDPETIGICIGTSGGCFDKCTKAGDTRKGCAVDSSNVSYEYTETCSDVDGKLVYVISDDKDCASTCKDDKSACK